MPYQYIKKIKTFFFVIIVIIIIILLIIIIMVIIIGERVPYYGCRGRAAVQNAPGIVRRGTVRYEPDTDRSQGH